MDSNLSDPSAPKQPPAATEEDGPRVSEIALRFIEEELRPRYLALPGIFWCEGPRRNLRPTKFWSFLTDEWLDAARETREGRELQTRDGRPASHARCLALLKETLVRTGTQLMAKLPREGADTAARGGQR